MEMLTDWITICFMRVHIMKYIEKLGAHLGQKNDEIGCYFALWAPHAQSVSVIGDFNNWNSKKHIMKRKKNMDFFELFIPGVKRSNLSILCLRERWKSL